MSDDYSAQLLQQAQIGNSLTRFSTQVESNRLWLELQRFWEQELTKPRHADPRRLLRYGFKVYSRGDGDGIIQEIFARVGTTNRTFIEFGVESGIECNTAKLLIEGWRGLWIEGAANHAATIRRTLDGLLKDGRLALTESMVTAENINALFEAAGFRGEIDLLSIDIDSNDYWVWKAVEIVKPRVVVIEYNATLHPPLAVVVPYDPKQQWDGSNYFGASLEALVRLGRAKGYRIVGCSFAGADAFFVRDDLCGDRFLEPATAEEHYEPPRYYFAYLYAGHSARLGPFVNV
jgi:hypothetical protein